MKEAAFSVAAAAILCSAVASVMSGTRFREIAKLLTGLAMTGALLGALLPAIKALSRLSIEEELERMGQQVQSSSVQVGSSLVCWALQPVLEQFEGQIYELLPVVNTDSSGGIYLSEVRLRLFPGADQEAILQSLREELGRDVEVVWEYAAG